MWAPCLMYTKDYLHAKNQEDTIISTGAGACLLLECEHKQDARHHTLVNKYFQEETKQEQVNNDLS